MAQGFGAFLVVFVVVLVIGGSAAAGRVLVEPYSQDFNGAAATLAAAVILALTVPWLGVFRWLYLRSVQP